MVTAAAVAVAAVGGVAGAPGGGVFDPGACLAAGYVFFLFCIQTHFLEWPQADVGVLALLAAAVVVFAIPTTASFCGVWGWPTWLTSLATDAALAVAAHRYMVRGPLCRPGEGSLHGRVCVVTGCNTGIGFDTAEALARAGAVVVFACRSEAKARAAMKRLLAQAGEARVREDQLRFIPLDVSSLRSVREFAAAFRKSALPLHLLILNAGVMLTSRALSEDGFELALASNHFGHFLLTRLLLPSLREAEARGEEPRIVAVSSALCYKHDVFDFTEAVKVGEGRERESFLAKPYTTFRAYPQSKLANVLFTCELARRLKESGSRIPVNAVHPGEVMTEVNRDLHPAINILLGIVKQYLSALLYAFFKTSEQGSYCTLHVATAPELGTADAVSGTIFVRNAPMHLPVAASSTSAAERLWEVSDALTGAPAM